MSDASKRMGQLVERNGSINSEITNASHEIDRCKRELRNAKHNAEYFKQSFDDFCAHPNRKNKQSQETELQERLSTNNSIIQNNPLEIIRLEKKKTELLSELKTVHQGINECREKMHENLLASYKAQDELQHQRELEKLVEKRRIEEVKLDIERLKQQGEKADRDEINALMNELKDM